MRVVDPDAKVPAGRSRGSGRLLGFGLRSLGQHGSHD